MADLRYDIAGEVPQGRGLEQAMDGKVFRPKKFAGRNEALLVDVSIGRFSRDSCKHSTPLPSLSASRVIIMHSAAPNAARDLVQAKVFARSGAPRFRPGTLAVPGPFCIIGQMPFRTDVSMGSSLLTLVTSVNFGSISGAPRRSCFHSRWLVSLLPSK